MTATVIDLRNGPQDHACRGSWHYLGRNRGGHNIYQCDASQPHRSIEYLPAHACRMEDCSDASTQEEWLQAEERRTVQAIADAYKSVAYSESTRVARSDMPVYRTMRAAMLTAIREVYSLSPVKAWRVYDVMIDSGEDVAWCVQFVKNNPGRHDSNAYEH